MTSIFYAVFVVFPREHNYILYSILVFMKIYLNKKQAESKISEFFQQKDFMPGQLKKIKRIAMKFNIKLGAYRKIFCKKCLYPIAGKLSITKTHRTIECKNCGHRNKLRIG